MWTDVDSWNFYDYVIAQSDDEDYDESGWVAVVKDGKAALGRYSHCSCYGTWTALCEGDYNDAGTGQPVFDWEGSPEELVALAKRQADPAMPERECDPEDYDYDHLIDVYGQIIKWSEGKS